jgi:U3 small nucleolar RNA-associated protein 24
MAAASESDDRLFLSHNTDLGPPYRVLVDTNFINFSIQNKIELVQGMMDCLMAKCEFTDSKQERLQS